MEKHVSHLVLGLTKGFVTTIDNINTMLLRILNVSLDVVGETSEIGGDGRHSHDEALSGSVTPRLVVRGEDTHVAAAHKVVIVDGEDGRIHIEELRVVDDLDAVVVAVDKVASLEMIKDLIVTRQHIMCNDRRKVLIGLHSLDAALHGDRILLREELVGIRNLATDEALIESLANMLRDLGSSIRNVTTIALTSDGFDVAVVSSARNDKESDHGDVGVGLLQHVVELSQGLDENVHTFVVVLATTSSEDVKSFVDVKVEVTVEVAPDELANFVLVLAMEVLELMKGNEFVDNETVRSDEVGLDAESVLSFVASDLGNSGEDVSSASRTSLDPVSVIDATATRLLVRVGAMDDVVEIDATSSHVAAKECGMGGENRGQTN